MEAASRAADQGKETQSKSAAAGDMVVRNRLHWKRNKKQEQSMRLLLTLPITIVGSLKHILKNTNGLKSIISRLIHQT